MQIRVETESDQPAVYFGFTPAPEFGFSSDYDVPDDVFMVLELIPEALTGKTGTIKYHRAFDTV